MTLGQFTLDLPHRATAFCGTDDPAGPIMAPIVFGDVGRRRFCAHGVDSGLALRYVPRKEKRYPNKMRTR